MLVIKREPAAAEPGRTMLSATLKQTVKNLREGKVHAADLCARCLQRARKLKELNFVVTETTEIAEAQATEASRRYKSGTPLSPLDGIPLAVKDNFNMRGVQTSCGSRMLADYKAPYTATVVQRLTDQGAVITAKTNMDEFAMGCGTVDSVWGPTKNPWRLKSLQRNTPGSDPHVPQTSPESPEMDPARDWYIAGGSSGGSAVAVATGSVFGAVGSDTGGSVRNPASYCGVVGLKPTYGLVSRHGLIPLVNSLDVPGIFARTVDDAAVILNALAGHDPLDSTTVTDTFPPVVLNDRPSIEGLHIGIPKEYHAPGLSKEVVELWDQAATVLEAQGARVSTVSLPHTQYSIVCYHLLSCCEIASNMARYDGLEYGLRSKNDSSTEALYAASRHAGFNDVVRGRILAGNYFLLRENYEHYFLKAQKVQRLIHADFKQVFAGGVDLLLTPTTLTTALHYDLFSKADNRTRTQEQDVLTQPVNMAGVPAVTVPSGISPTGLPIGLQLIGRPFGEQTLLSAAKWLQQELNCPTLNLDWLEAED